MESRQKWGIMINGQPFNLLPEVSVKLTRLTPEEIKMHTTRTSKKRIADPIKSVVGQEKRETAIPPPAKKFKRIVLPCDNSDDEQSSDSDDSSQRRNVHSVSLDWGVKSDISKVMQIRRNSCSEANHQSNRTNFRDVHNLKAHNLKNVFIASNLNKSKNHYEPDNSARSLSKNHLRICVENKLFKRDVVKKIKSNSDSQLSAKNKLLKKTLKNKREVTDDKHVLIDPPRDPDKALLVENRHTSATKHSLKTFGKQLSPLLSTNNKEEYNKSTSKLAVLSGHETKIDEKVPKLSRVDVKSKHLHFVNEKLQNFPKVTEKSGNLSNIDENSPQVEVISTTAHEQELERKCTGQNSSNVSVIVAENIYELIDEYELFMATPGNSKTGGEKKNDKKPSQKKMLNMFGEEHLMEDSRSIYKAPLNCLPIGKEKALFPDVTSTSDQLDNVKILDNFDVCLSHNQENPAKLKPSKFNPEANFSKSKDENSVKENDTKKKKLNESVHKQRIEKSRSNSIDTSLEKSKRYSTNAMSLVKKDQTNSQNKTQANLTDNLNDSKNSSGNKCLPLTSQICGIESGVGKSIKNLEMRNANGVADRDHAKRIKQDEKPANIEKEGKKVVMKKLKEKTCNGILRKESKILAKSFGTTESSKYHNRDEKLGQLQQEKSDSYEDIHFSRQKEVNAFVEAEKEVSSRKNEKEEILCGSKSVDVVVGEKVLLKSKKDKVVLSKHENTKVTSNGKLKVTSTEVFMEEVTSGENEEENLSDAGKISSTDKEYVAERLTKNVAEALCINTVSSKSQIVSTSSVINSSVNNLSNEGKISQVNKSSNNVSLFELVTGASNTSNFTDSLVESHNDNSLNVEKGDMEIIDEDSNDVCILIEHSGCKQSNIDFISEEMRADASSEELKKLELEYENLEKMVGEASAKKYMIWQQIQHFHGIQVIKKEESVDDDDDCQVIVPDGRNEDTLMTCLAKEEHDKANLVATELVDWSDESTSSKQNKSDQVLEGPNKIMLICNPIVEDPISAEQNKSGEVMDSCNVSRLVSSSAVATEDSTSVQQKKNGEAMDGCHSSRLIVSSTVAFEGEDVSEQLPRNQSINHNGCEATASRENEFRGHSIASEPKNTELGDSGNSCAIREKRIRVRGIDDLLAKPNNIAVNVPQASVLEKPTEQDGFLSECFINQEGVNVFRELVKVMVILGKATESFIAVHSADKTTASSASVILQNLIHQHCLLVYRLCKKVIMSCKESAECFLSILFMQTLTKWQGYLGKFNLQHLKVLLKSTFHAALKFVSPPNRVIFEKEACYLLKKMGVFPVHKNQIPSLIVNSSQNPNIVNNNQNACANNIVVPNNNSSLSQLLNAPPPVNHMIRNTRKDSVDVHNSACQNFVESISPVREEQVHSNLGSISTEVGPRTLGHEISSTTDSRINSTNSVQPQQTQDNLNSYYCLTNETYTSDSYGNVSNLTAKPGPFYRSPPPHYSVLKLQQKGCHKPQPMLFEQVIANQDVVVAQQSTSHLQRMVDMTQNAQLGSGSQTASQQLLNPICNIQKGQSYVQQQLQKPKMNVLTMQQTVSTFTNHSQETVNGQYELYHNNYQLKSSKRASDLQEQNSTLQQYPQSQRPSFPASALQEQNSTLQQYPQSQRLSFPASALQETNSTLQQHLQSQRPSFPASALQATNSTLQQHLQSQRPSFRASSLQEPSSILQQVQVLRNNNPFSNLIELQKQRGHHPSVDQLQHYSQNNSNIHSTVRQVQAPEWINAWHIDANGQQIPTTLFNHNRNEVLPQIRNSIEGIEHWHGREHQLPHSNSKDATGICVSRHLKGYHNDTVQSQVLQEVSSQHGAVRESKLSNLMNQTPNKKTFGHENYSGNVAHQHYQQAQQLAIQQNASRPSIIQTAPHRGSELQMCDEHSSPVLGKSHPSLQSSSLGTTQRNVLLSSIFYTSNLHNKNIGVGSSVHNNSVGKVVTGSCRQPLLPSMTSPAHGTSSALPPEESDQVRGQGLSRSISRDSGYRSPSQGAECVRGSSAKNSGKCYVCHKEAILTCSRCKAVFYCNTDCQVGDWQRHKIECKTSS